MSSIYVCEVCGHKVDPKGTTVLQYVSGWVRGSGKSLQAIDERSYRWRHEVCLNAEKEEESPTLFG